MSQHSTTDNQSFSNRSLLKMSSIVYGAMAAVGLVICLVFHQNFSDQITIPTESEQIYRLLILGVVAAGSLLILSYNFENWFAGYRSLKASITKLLGPSSIPVALYLAFVSSVAEEILFRGAIQPFVGLWITSILFGLVHLSPEGKISFWSVWAFIAGLVLGWLVEDSGSLWPAIIAHFLVNSVSILHMRVSWRKWNESKA